MAEITVDMNKLNLRKYATVRVRIVGEKRLRLRMRLGLLLIRFGVWVAGVNFRKDEMEFSDPRVYYDHHCWLCGGVKKMMSDGTFECPECDEV